jgi:hypothetical protein
MTAVVVEGTPVSESKEKDEKYKEWEIEGWADTLVRAAEIQADAEKMKLVEPYLAKKEASVKSIADIRKRAAKLAKSK